MRLRAIGGTMNRAQAMLSYRSAHGPIDVLWEDDVPHFLETFHPLEGIRFVHGRTQEDVIDYGIAPTAPADWRKAYADLRPLPHVETRVAEIRESLGAEYIAIHVRRTDMTPLAAKIGHPMPTDADYLKWCAQWPDLPVYLATDNGQTQARYLDADARFRVGARMGGYEIHTEYDHTIHGPIFDAIVDMFVCVEATRWAGQSFGTFSGTIKNIRDVRGLESVFL